MHNIAVVGPLSVRALVITTAAGVGICLGVTASPAMAQTAQNADSAQSRAWQPGFVAHMRRMRQFLDHTDGASQRPPQAIPKLEIDEDERGKLGTYQPGGRVFTRNNPFFEDLGTNGRTCFTCHQPQEGWSFSADGARARFAATAGNDPLFRLADGATCPTANVSTRAERQKAYKLLTEKGLIRIGLPMPTASEFKIVSLADPYGCNTDPATGLTSPTTGIVSVYRRPLPATNLGFLSTIMWDGREPDLVSQAIDATLGHAQGETPPTPAQQAAIVAFESGLFTAQADDNVAGDLGDANATGGPIPLSRQVRKFFVGVNDPAGGNPRGTPFTSRIFNLFKPWQGAAGPDDAAKLRKSIARGEQLFNNTPINITGVGGINDPAGPPRLIGTCGTCHDAPNAGSHSVKVLLNIGVADAGPLSPPALDISPLPVFMITCTTGPLAGRQLMVTDLGLGLITGKCADIGKLKTPTLRGLAARAPYFHNGSAASLQDVVNFYDQRFAIGFTAREKQDLVNFLNAL